MKKNSVFFFGISFFIIEIITFFHYANEESADVKTVQYSIKNIARNIKAVLFKFGT